MKARTMLTHLTEHPNLRSTHAHTRTHIHAYTRDTQSTEKSVLYGFLSLVSVYGQKNDLWPNLQIFSRLRYSTEKNRFLDESTDFCVLSSATNPPPPSPPPSPPPPTLDSRRVNLFGCAKWTFSATTRNLRIFRLGNPDTPPQISLLQFSPLLLLSTAMLTDFDETIFGPGNMRTTDSMS